MQDQPRYRHGDTIGGRYRVHQALMGGMGEVYLCLDLEEMLPFALKTLQRRYLANPQARDLFEEEVSTRVALEKHPNIVRCFYLHTLDNQPFMFLEWVAGEEGKGTDLSGWLRNGPLDLRLALDFTIDICRGLRHAHHKQPDIVHRDLNPHNVLVSQDRLAKITDFGLARVAQLTGGAVAGTPMYMAPEQWRGEELDVRTDLYAVGCILYELLTGSWPYQASTQRDLRRMHKAAPTPRLPSDSAVPEAGQQAIDGLIERCMAKRREDRWGSVEELLEEVASVYQEQFGAAPRPVAESEEFTAQDYTNRGKTYADLRQYDKALADLDQAIQLISSEPLFYIKRSLTYDLLHPEALADLNKAIEVASSEALVHTNRGGIYRDLQQYDRALADFDQAIERDPAFAPAYIHRGVTYDALQKYDRALADYDMAIQLDPSDSRAYFHRGNTYHGLQQYDKALADYGKAIQLDPNDTAAYYNRGVTYSSLQRYDEALADYDMAIQLDPSDAQAFYDRGVTYHELQQDERALADFTTAIELDPIYAGALYNRGVTYAGLQRYDEALADYTMVIQLDPTLAPAYCNVGVLLANQGGLSEALPFFEQAARLGDPQAAEYAQRVRQMLRGG